MAACTKWGDAMDAHGFMSGEASCDECLCALFPCTISLDAIACPFIAPVWLISKLVKRCKQKDQSATNVVVNA
jgi:hypothetical protein